MSIFKRAFLSRWFPGALLATVFAMAAIADQRRWWIVLLTFFSIFFVVPILQWLDGLTRGAVSGHFAEYEDPPRCSRCHQVLPRKESAM